RDPHAPPGLATAREPGSGDLCSLVWPALPLRGAGLDAARGRRSVHRRHSRSGPLGCLQPRRGRAGHGTGGDCRGSGAPAVGEPGVLSMSIYLRTMALLAFGGLWILGSATAGVVSARIPAGAAPHDPAILALRRL